MEPDMGDMFSKLLRFTYRLCMILVRYFTWKSKRKGSRQSGFSQLQKEQEAANQLNEQRHSHSTPSHSVEYVQSIERTTPSNAGHYISPAGLPDCPVPVTLRDPIWPLTRELVRFGQVIWTLRDSTQGTVVFGDTGSGKSSTIAVLLISAFIEAWFAILFLCVKISDAVRYLELVAASGRADQVIHFRPGGPYRINPFEYWRLHPNPRTRSPKNMVACIEAIVIALAGARGRKDEESFWSDNRRQLHEFILIILIFSGDPFGFLEILDFYNAIPKTYEELQAGAWRNSRVFYPRMMAALKRTSSTSDARQVQTAYHYFLERYWKEPQPTQQGVAMGLMAILNVFNDKDIHELFGTDTTVIPEHIVQGGAILICDLPTHRDGEIGVFANTLWQVLFRNAVDQRDDPDGDTRIPCALIQDEKQEFAVTASDARFQATCRSGKCAVVVITQSLPNLIAQCSAQHPEAVVNGYLSNFGTYVFHRISDPQTQQLAAQRLGRSQQVMVSRNINRDSGLAGFINPSGDGGMSLSYHEDWNVPPDDLLTLKTGGSENDFIAEAFIVFPAIWRVVRKQYLKIEVHQIYPGEQQGACDCNHKSFIKRMFNFFNPFRKE